MTQWYYADASGQRHGPFSAEELESHVRHARLGAASLVWREGLQDWQPLGSLASYKAAWEMVTRPFWWDKTSHGPFDGSGPT